MDFNENLFRQLILYISAKAPRKKLGTVKFNKILWFFDKSNYDMGLGSVTGETYIKKPRGPVASHFFEVCDALVSEGLLKVNEKPHNPAKEQFGPVEYICRHIPDTPELDERKLGMLDLVINIICNSHTSRTISIQTHDKIWENAEIDEPLHFASYYASEAAPDAELLSWAEEHADEFFDEIEA